jgi:hypothetical protein
MAMFHGTQTEIYFNRNYYCTHNYAHFYKDSLPEELLPSLHSGKYNIALNSEDGITANVILRVRASRQPYISLQFRA